MEKIWATLLAFAVMCIIYPALKLFGVEWAAERSWTEAIIFLCVAIALIVLFCLRKKINALIDKIKNNK